MPLVRSDGTLQKIFHRRMSMCNEPKVMLGMSFFRDGCDKADATAAAYAKALWPGNNVVLGIETDGFNRDEDGLKSFINNRLRENWSENIVYLWDEIQDKSFFPHWPSDLPMPFYQKGFSYGGMVNRLLALAKIAGCDFLVRVDPGTAPPYYFQQMVKYHIQRIEAQDQVWVVSGQYTDRIALRDHFVPEAKQSDYHNFMFVHTGINPFRQITGGAAFTLSVAKGPPSIPFDGFTPVWGSDDGVYQTLMSDNTLVLSESRILRTDPGIVATKGKEYPIRLASMVALCHLIRGYTTEQAESTALGFLKELKDRKYYEDYDPPEAQEELGRRLKNIAKGWQNYEQLRQSWEAVIEKIGEISTQHFSAS